ncbi:hypothetical protein GCM10023085_22870 [Actinomadura viridis]
MTYSEEGFEIQVPSSWKRRAGSGDSSESVYWDAPDGVTYLQVDAQAWDYPETPRAQAEKGDEGARTNKPPFKGYSLIGISDLNYQDGDAADWEFTFDAPSGAGRIHSQDRFFRAGGRPFAMYLRTADTSWEPMQDELDVFYETFRPR